MTPKPKGYGVWESMAMTGLGLSGAAIPTRRASPFAAKAATKRPDRNHD